jgi:O-antigen/teichoic acid export membrane protein
MTDIQLFLPKLSLPLSGIKKLAGDTLWYGLPTVATRFLSYALALLAFRYEAKVTGNLTLVYAIIPFLNVLFTYGLETSYFRYTQLRDKTRVYNTLMVSIIVTTTLFTALLLFFKGDMVSGFRLNEHPEYITWMIWILFFDTLAVLPFARLREEGRPKKFAFIKIANIVVNVAIVVFFTIICEKLYRSNPNSFFLKWYNPELKVGYFIIANLVASIVTLLLLYKEMAAFRWKFDTALWKEIMKYSYPLIIVGFGGMINEMLSRVMYEYLSGLPEEAAKHNLGVFGANYKLAVLITIFIQVFRMAAEPFFFKKAADTDARKTYARVMKFFVIACCIMFLCVVLFLDVWKYLIAFKHKEYTEGIGVVPILALGYVFLGIYYNLSVWYKLTNKNMAGAAITLMGVAITIVFNLVLIPVMGYHGAAWTELLCYGAMMVISYLWGQKNYAVPYAWKKLMAYIVICLLFFGIQQLAAWLFPAALVYYVLAFFLLGLFCWFVVQVEKKELKKLPYLGRFIK